MIECHLSFAAKFILKRSQKKCFEFPGGTPLLLLPRSELFSSKNMETETVAMDVDNTVVAVELDEKMLVNAGNENAVAAAETDGMAIGVESDNKTVITGNDNVVAVETTGNGNVVAVETTVAAEEGSISGSTSKEAAVDAVSTGITKENVGEGPVAVALDTENAREAIAEDSVAVAVETENNTETIAEDSVSVALETKNTTETIAEDSIIVPAETDNTRKATAEDSDDVVVETCHTMETTAEDGVLISGEVDDTIETIGNDGVMVTVDENNAVETEVTLGEDQVMVTLEANNSLETMGAKDGSIVSIEIDNAVVTLEADADVAKIEVGNAMVAVEAENDLIALETVNAIVPATDMEAEYAIVPATPATPEDDDEPTGFELQPNKRRRKKSIVWEHFTVETIGPGHTRACCKQCKKSFAYITGSKLAGTSHLKRHIALGICPVSRQKNQLSPYTPSPKILASGSSTDHPKRRYRLTPAPANVSLDQERCSHEIAKMIILHDHPLHIVEHSGFIDFVKTIQPQYNMASFNTVQGDIVAIYLREKQKLLNIVRTIPGRVSLTLDLWTSNQNLGYVFITGHFVDIDWRIHRKILNVVMIPFPDAENAFNQAVVASLSDWNLESKLFTLTVDPSVSNNNHMVNLRGLLALKNPHMLDGQLLIGNCYARVLSRLAQDAFGSMGETIKKIRDSVKNVKTSEANEERFDELKQRLQVPITKELIIDDITKWDTTYRMLVVACELKEVFACFDTSDPDYTLTPSMDEWKQVETLCSYMKILYDAAKVLTGPSYPTTNTFFHEVTRIQLDLAYAAMSDDLFISSLIKPLKEKFDRFWKQTCLVLAVAVVMDPRFKMKLVEFSFFRIFGEDAEAWIRTVDDGIHELFLEYLAPTPLPFPVAEEGNEAVVKAEAPEDKVSGEELAQGETFISFGDGLSDFDVYISEITGGHPTKSELDQYLEESLMPRVQDFDVLGWWKLNNMKFPTLSKMAADILAMPISSVRPDAVFDTGGGKIDGYRGSLRPVTLEALICAKDWHQSDMTVTQMPR